MSKGSQAVLKNRTAKSDAVRKLKETVGCLVCGESESICLDFHHLDSSNKSATISSMLETHKPLKDILNEIKKCVILCSNCHRKLHAGLHTIPEHSRSEFHAYVDSFVKEKIRKEYRCVDCGSVVSTTALRCRSCSIKNAVKIKWPDSATLCYLISIHGYSGTARHLNVSDNAVRKRYKNHCS